jgi:hypothetical protein
MTNLSPAAQAVRDAVLATYADNIPKDDNLWALERASTVAALRAARDELAPSKTIKDIDYVHQSYVDGYEDALDEILIIVNELEAH